MKKSRLRGKNITRTAMITPNKVMKTMNIPSRVMTDASWEQQAVRHYKISGEEHPKPERAAEHQRAIGDHLGHRTRQDDAQNQQRQSDQNEEYRERMGKDVVAERPAVGEQAKA